jgi:TRAP-type C4-dicarboxylate transport system substrate-binding protein
MRLQTSGESGTNIAKACGIVVVTMGTADLYDAISKGTIDGTIYPPEYYAQYKWMEIAKFIMWDANFTGTENQIGFNIKTLNKLPADVKKIITDIGDTGESADLFNAIVAIAAKQSLITKDAPANKVEIVSWAKADQDKLAAVIAPEKDKWVPSMVARGFADAGAVFSKWVELYNKYDALYPAKQKAMGWGNY